MKGPIFVTWHPNFTPKKPMDSISLVTVIPNTNEFSQGQLGLLAKKGRADLDTEIIHYFSFKRKLYL